MVFIVQKDCDISCLPAKLDGVGGHRKVTPVENVLPDRKVYWQVR